MNKLLATAAAAVVAAGIAPAVAQTANSSAPKPAREMTRSDIQARVADHFARLDSNRDGFVTREEADSVRKEMREKMVERRAEHRARMFDEIDANRDGSITRSEWAAHEPSMHRVMVRKIAGKDGEVTEHRMPGTPGRHRMGGGAMMMMGPMFEMADADKDGRVSLQEAQGAAGRHFDRMDSNRDGRITPDERGNRRIRIERRPG